MTIFICTAGTSIATNQGVDIKDIENQPFSTKKEPQSLSIECLQDTVQGFFARYKDKHEIEKVLDRTSAEIKSLAKMGLSEGDRVHLLVSDTLDGHLCAEMNQKYLKKYWNCDVFLEMVPGLQALDSEEFRKKGLKNLLDKVIRLIEENKYQTVRLNVTGGYKSVIPYVTLLGMLYDCPINYIYEKSYEIITLEKIPVSYDESLILEVETKLAIIDKETEIGRDKWEDGIPYESRSRYEALIEESSPGYVTMSAIGMIFYEKFKTDFPPELVKDLTQPDSKKIHLAGTHHGKDILYAFGKKLVKSPYVKHIECSSDFDSKQKDPIKRCSENGQIELILTHTVRGYGMIIQTTGRNLEETKLIAEKLREKYFR